jgi:hypothetical protein
MQDAMKGKQGGTTHQEPKDQRGNPIETSSTPTDPGADPAPVGNPRPPYGGPEGGGPDQH